MRIDVSHVTKCFGKIEALRDVAFSIPQGGRVALVGPNGSGKSTLLRALLGLIECDGTILLDGSSPYQNRIEAARAWAYVPQVPPSLGASCQELLTLVVTTRNLEPAAVERKAAELNLRLSDIARRPFRNLSGGMKQKFLLSLALASTPRLLVLDEPTASLDEATRQRFFDLCQALPSETTVLLCSHRHEELSRLAQRIIQLEDGRIRTDGTAGVGDG
ncbi:MAG: ABC transporter ATP-binding protein [Myxococcaceae bacterium]